ncbi:MFS transporter [Actinoplanes sp. NPDC049316]|uniref:MFS transporter n=1 Tax=Actinoplanes sp. NPDC049316 TaxID=3154727 RepID=UPI003441F6D6
MTRPATRLVPAGVTGGHETVTPARRTGIVAALAITQTIGYGTLYYAFAVLLTPLAVDLHASTTAVTGAFTASVLTGAALAVPVGRWLDHRGGRALMTGGSAAGALLLVALSQVDRLWQLYLVQIGIGAAAAASLYEAAFAVVIAVTTAERRSRALLAITVVAGFASSVFLPLTGWLTDAHGWRATLIVLAVLQALTVPLHAFVLRGSAPSRTLRRASQAPSRGVRAALTDRGFWLLAIGFTAHTAAISAFTVHLVAALISWGHRPAFAATIAGLLGALSVAGRLITTGLQRRHRTTTITATMFAVQAAAALLLPIAGARTGGVIGAVIGFGLGFGVATLAKPILLAERYDTRRYATLAGALVVPMTLAKATAPLAAAYLHTASGSYVSVFAAVALCCALAATMIAAASSG